MFGFHRRFRARAQEAFKAPNGILGFEVKIENSGHGVAIERFGATVRLGVGGKDWLAHLSLSVARIEKLVGDIGLTSGQTELYVARMQKLVGEPPFAQAAVVGRVG